MPFRQPRCDLGDGGAERIFPLKAFVELVLEALADVVALSPFPEFLLARFLVLFGEEVEVLFLEGEAAGIEVAASESDDIGSDLAEATEVGLGFVFGRGEGVGGGGETEGDPLDELGRKVGGGTATTKQRKPRNARNTRKPNVRAFRGSSSPCYVQLWGRLERLQVSDGFGIFQGLV